MKHIDSKSNSPYFNLALEEHILKNKEIKELIDNGKFANVIILSNESGEIGKIKEIYSNLEKIEYNKVRYEEVI